MFRQPSATHTILRTGALKISMQPSAEISTYSLGSGLAVTAYDPKKKIGGMLNTLLPDTTLDPEKSEGFPCLFVDKGVQQLLIALEKVGVKRSELQIKIAGGAHALQDGHLFDIGERNVQIVQETLKQNQVQLIQQLVGGTLSLNVSFRLADGTLRVFAHGLEEEIIL